MTNERWLIYALLAAVMASFVGIFGKIGMKNADSMLATVIRSIIMTMFLIAVGTTSNVWPEFGTIKARSFAAILLSGIAGALSWLFYFKAIQMGEVSKVVAIDKLSMPLAIVLAIIVLGDRPTLVNWIGILLMVAGAYLAVLPKLPAA